MRTTTFPAALLALALLSAPLLAGDAPAKSPGAKKLHEHHAQHGGQVGMWKDWHLEVLEPVPGEVQVWLTDAARDPVDSARVTGIAVVTPEGSKPTQVPLEKGGRSDGFFSARFAPLAGPHEVEVILDGLAEKVFMSFLFPVPGAGAPHEHGPGAAGGTQPASQPGSETQGATQPATQGATQPATQGATQPSTQGSTASQPGGPR